MAATLQLIKPEASTAALEVNTPALACPASLLKSDAPVPSKPQLSIE